MRRKKIRRSNHVIPLLRETLYLARLSSSKSYKELGKIFQMSGSCVRYHCNRHLQKELERKQMTAFIRLTFSEFEDLLRAVLISNSLVLEGKLSGEQGLRSLLALRKFLKEQIKLFEKLVKAQRTVRSKRIRKTMDLGQKPDFPD